MKKRFSFIELLITLVILSILTAYIIPQVIEYFDKTKENVLRNNLSEMRRAILRYARDNQGRYPSRLVDLVSSGYLKEIPMDPFLDTNTKWQVRGPLTDPRSQYEPIILDSSSWTLTNAPDSSPSPALVYPTDPLNYTVKPTYSHFTPLAGANRKGGWFSMYDNLGPVNKSYLSNGKYMFFPGVYTGGIYDVRSGDRVVGVIDVNNNDDKFYHRDIDTWYDTRPVTGIKWPLQF